MSGELKIKTRRKIRTKSTHMTLAKYDIADLDRPHGERWVTMANALIRAAHGLSLSEKRLVSMAISELNSSALTRWGEDPITTITATDYAATYDLDVNTAYEQLAAAGDALFDRVITFYEPAYNRKGKALEPTKKRLRWVSEAHYQKGEGWIKLFWLKRLLPYLTGIKKNFTSYQLQQASALRSIYSWRLLELITQYTSTGWMEFTVEDFGMSMEATEKQMADFAKLRTKIIEPAVKELVEKSGWLIQWTPIKAGRKVSRLRFEFRKIRNPICSLQQGKHQLPIGPDMPPLSQPPIDNLEPDLPATSRDDSAQ